MKNKEKYREQIENIVFAGSTIAVTKTTGEPTICNGNIRCRECLFYDGVDQKCYEARSAWLNQDADEIDWKNVPVDTLVEVLETGDAEWRKRYFAGNINGRPSYFQNGATSKTTDFSPVQLDEDGFIRIVDYKNILI